MEPLISFIIPVYNVEAYLLRCLKSIEPFIALGYEVIIVNDGSTDSSKDIINKFVRENPTVITVCQDNAGLSAARNVGLKCAHGSYIWFVDSDDYIDQQEFCNVVKEVTRDESDIVVFGRVEEFQTWSVKTPGNLRTQYGMLGQDYFLSSINDGSFRTNVWDKLFKRTLLEKHELKFVEGLIYEDMFFCLKAFMYAKTVSVYSFYPYHYININSNSITRQIRIKDLDVLKFIHMASEFVSDDGFVINAHSKEFQLLIFNWVSSCLMNKYAYLSLYNKQAETIFYSVCADDIFMNLVLYCSKNKIGIRQTIFAKLLLFSPTLYKVLLNIALKIQKMKFKYLK